MLEYLHKTKITEGFSLEIEHVGVMMTLTSQRAGFDDADRDGKASVEL